jgi:transcriptional regulator with XRE-family HTH domain
MILNDRQLSATRKEIVLLEEKISQNQYPEDIRTRSQNYAWQCRIEDMTAEIAEYLYLRNNPVLTFDGDNLDKAIMSMRVASGMTQKALADALDINEQQIQRYERLDYLTASFGRAVQILRVLGKSIKLRVTVNRDTVSTENRFENVWNPQVESVMKKTRERQCIINYGRGEAA